MTAYEYEVTFGGDENNLELGSSGDSWFKHIEKPQKCIFYRGKFYGIVSQ